MNVLQECSTPWKAVKVEFGAWIEDGHGKTIITTKGKMFDFEILEFIAETVNNSARPRITDTLCDCDCGWTDTVENCLPDIDGDSSLGCPRCQAIVEVIA